MPEAVMSAATAAVAMSARFIPNSSFAKSEQMQPRSHENTKKKMVFFVPSCLRGCISVVASVRGRLRRPDGALVLLRDRREALEHELLQPLTAVRLGHVDVALRVGRDAVDRVELARLPAAVAEARELGQRLAIEDVDLLVGAVGEIEILLLRILRERDVPHRSVA